MKSKMFAAMTITLTISAAMVSGAAVAQHVTVRIDAPEFGIRIGHPGYPPPIFVAPAPVYVPPPVYFPHPVVRYPAPVYHAPVYLPPRVIYAPPPVVLYPYPGRGYRHGHSHGRHDGYRGHYRDDDHGRYRGHEGRTIENVRVRTH